MIYLYDGSFEGLMTCIFYGYSVLNKLVDIQVDKGQMSLIDEMVKITTEADKSDRIVRYLIDKFGYEFFMSVYYVYLSSSKTKEISMIRTIFLGRDIGSEIIHSRQDDVVEFMKNRVYVSNERHFYLGLLRFTELKDGLLYAQFEPENNILPIIMGHFKNRLGDRPFIIHDMKRHILGVYENEISFVSDEGLDIRLEEIDDVYESLWKVFHTSIAIENMINPKLQSSNLHKKYWKYMTEMK